MTDTMRFHIHTHPEVLGWAPLMEWLTDHDLDPALTRGVTIDGTRATAEVMRNDDTGARILNDDRTDVATWSVAFTVQRPLPVGGHVTPGTWRR